MAGAVKHAKLESRTARSRLKRGRQPHWQALVPGKVHLAINAGRVTRSGAGCCGATSATASTALRHWAALTM